MKKIFLAALFSPLLQFAFAQDKIECDRPDQTETPAIVPNGHFQMENGFYRVHEGRGEKGFVYPASLLKYGIKDIAEFRLEIENSSTQLQDEEGRHIVHGISPIAFGMKLKICEEKKSVPKTSVILMMSIPVLAFKAKKENYPTPEIRFTFQHSLSNRVSFSYNLGGLWDGQEEKFFALYTITSGYSITDDWGLFIELYGFVAKEQDHRLDGGITFTPRKNIMLDISGGISIDRRQPAWFGGLGVSFRLPD
jgi:hypothetical protein